MAGISVGLTYVLLTRLVQPVFQGWSPFARWLVIIAPILMARIIVQFDHPVWQWEAGPQASCSPQTYTGSSWGAIARVLELHASDPSDPAVPWPWQAVVDLSDKLRGPADGQLSFQLTQPEWAVIDGETGQAFQGSDGVFITFKIERAGTWHLVQQTELNLHNQPSQREWQTVQVNIPADSQKLMIEVFPGPWGSDSNNWHDRVWISTEPVLATLNIFRWLDIITLSWLIMLLIGGVWLVAQPVLVAIPAWLNYAPSPDGIDKRFEWVLIYLTPRKLFKFYLVGAGIVAVLMIPVAVRVAPWYHAAMTPVQLELEAPLDTQIELCWDKAGQACSPLVPYANPDEKNARLWLGELPPRPFYELSLIFRSPGEHVALRGLTLVNTQHLESPVFQRRSDSPTMWFVPEDVNVQYLNQVFDLSTESGGRLSLPGIIRPSQSHTWLTVVFVWLLLVGALLVFGALALPLLRLDSSATDLPPVKFSGNLRLWWVAFGLATTLHILLVVNSQVLYDPNDSNGYLVKAVSLAELGTYDTGGYQFELNRLPGYPLLLAALLKLSGYRLTIVTMLQGAMLSVAVLALALSLRRWLPPFIGAIGIMIAILSPFQIWASRYILTESAFATFATLSLAAFFEHVGTKEIRSKMWWLMAYAGLATFAVFIRPSGIVLFAPLILVYLPKLMSAFLQEATMLDKVRSLVWISFPYILAIAVLIGAIVGWSVRNYLSRDYFGHSDVTGVYMVETLMQSGFFEPNSLLRIEYPPEFNIPITSDQPNLSPEPGFLLYDEYLTDKYLSQYSYNAWLLRAPIFNAISENGHKATNKTISLLDDIFKQIAHESNSLLPWPAHLASLLRVGWWAVAWPDETTFDRKVFRCDYQIWFLDAATLQKFIQTYITSYYSKLIYDMRNESPLTTSFSEMAKWYYEGYFILLLVALLSSLYAFWHRQPVLGSPFLVFAANMALNVYLLGIRARFIHIFDIFLVFQSAIGISLLIGESRKVRFAQIKKKWQETIQ
jgi:hypothetical protein